jgi:transposase
LTFFLQLVDLIPVDHLLATLVDALGLYLGTTFSLSLTHLKTSPKLFMDETPAPVLDPGRGKTKKGYFWALARDDRGWNRPEPPGVAFTYAPGRSGTYASEILQGFEGILQVDGYAGYNRVLRLWDNAPIQLVHCWAHARRKLFDLTHHNVAPFAEEGLK